MPCLLSCSINFTFSFMKQNICGIHLTNNNILRLAIDEKLNQVLGNGGTVTKRNTFISQVNGLQNCKAVYISLLVSDNRL